MEDVLKDQRFSHILTDPRFRKMPKHVRKITVDKRFKDMFKDRKFKEKCVLDKRGRPLNLTPSENLKNLYDISSESDENEDKEEDCMLENKMKKHSNELMKSSVNSKLNLIDESLLGDDVSSVSESEEVLKNKVNEANMLNQKSEKSKLKPLAKDKQFLKNKVNEASDSAQIKENEDPTSSDGADGDSSDESDDTDDSESDDSNEVQNEDFDHKWEEFQNDAPRADQITRRFAVCNMDWDRIRAEDLFVCFNSFKPSDGYINSIKIYPSEYGLKRMEEENINGPPELVEENLPLDEEQPEDKKGSRYHREKLRQYQINRLKYYYAVVVCDSPETADAIYEALNGIEYESSSIRYDLRFIPDDMTFDQKPVSVVDKVPDLARYKPRLFVTSALQQVKVDLTWDETDPKRRETLQKAFTEPESIENDIQDYLASSSGESEGELSNPEEQVCEKLSVKDRIAKYRELLQSLEEREKNEKEDKNKYELEITWEPGLKEKTEKIINEKMKSDSLNPFDEMLEKKKEGKKLKKKELKAKNKQDDDEFSDSADEDSITTINRKNKDAKKLAELALISDSKNMAYSDENYKKKKKEKVQKLDDFKCDVNDPRFAAIYSSSLYNIDPSDPHFKKTEGNLALIQEKQRKLKSTDFSERRSKRPRYS